jgi:hypothetical protein
MNFPTIFDWLERLDFLRGAPAAFGVLVTAVLIVLVWDKRLALFALAVQYFFVGILYVELLDPRLIVVKLITGWFVCLILYMTGRQVNWGRLPEDVLPEEVHQVQVEERVKVGPFSVPASLPLRALLALGMLVLVLLLAGQSGLSDLSVLQNPETLPAVQVGIYGLMGFGLLTLALHREPLQASMGLLMFLSGFELFYSDWEQSVAVLAALALVNLVVALAASYLVQKRYQVTAILD